MVQKNQEKVVSDPKANATDIGGLIGFSIYSAEVAAFNRMGVGQRTPSYPDRTTTDRARKILNRISILNYVLSGLSKLFYVFFE